MALVQMGVLGLDEKTMDVGSRASELMACLVKRIATEQQSGLDESISIVSLFDRLEAKLPG